MGVAVVDFHSHVLPAIDDGSRNVDTSIAMMKTSVEQGVGCIVATPHFYASRDRIDDFLKKRSEAYAKVRGNLEKYPLKMLCGAEVAYFDGISRAEHLGKLAIEGTRTLLIEMPFIPWNSSVMKELERLVCRSEYQIVLAHVERYFTIPENKQGIKQILDMPVTIQVNAESLLEWKSRRRAIKLLSEASRCVLGSDCHGMHHRVPNLGEGRKILEKKLGQKFLNEMDTEAARLLQVK